MLREKLFRQKKGFLFLLILGLLLFAASENIFAADVRTFDDLKSAINNAADGEVININSPITLNETLVIENKSITIGGNASLSASQSLKTNEITNTLFVVKNSNLSFKGLGPGQKLTLNGAKINRIIYSENSNLTFENAELLNGCPANDASLNAGGGIFIDGGSLTARNTDFIGNASGDYPYLMDRNGGAIYGGSRPTDIKITGGVFLTNRITRKGNGAAIYQNAGNLIIKGTVFKENNSSDNKAEGACIHTRKDVKAKVSNVSVFVTKGFNTGGFLKSYGSTIEVGESTFVIRNLGDKYGQSGGVFSMEGGKTAIKDSDFRVDGTNVSRLAHGGGFIYISGDGDHTIEGNTMTGNSKDTSRQTAFYGGAICIENGTTASVTIKDNKITSTSVVSNGGAIAIGTDKAGKTPSTVNLSGNTISYTGTLMLSNQTGGALFIGPGAVVTMDGDQIDYASSKFAGAIYNEGHLSLSGSDAKPTKISNNKAFMAAGILNKGYLKIDRAVFSNNSVEKFKGSNSHINKEDEMAGENIYAAKDVIITPNARFDGRDIRLLDGQSKIILTGPLTGQVNVSISETPISSGNNLFLESQKRRLGYLVAEGDGTYRPTAADAEKIHYVSKDTKQPRADKDDHTSPGKWDFVLNPQTNQIVLGQRLRLSLDANGTDDAPTSFENITEGRDNEKSIYTSLVSDSIREDSYDIYGPGEKLADLSPEPVRKGYIFTGWYIEEVVKDDESDENKDGKTLVKDLKLFENTDEITNIIEPNEFKLYAGWKKSVAVEKVWDDSDDAYKNRPESLDVQLLYKGQEVGRLRLSAENNWKGEFTNLPDENTDFTAYSIKEIPDQVLGYEKTLVTGDFKDGFTLTSKTEFITIEGSKTWIHNGNTGPLPTEVTVTLNENGSPSDKKLTGSTWKFENLPKYKNKALVNYTLTEDPVKNYTSSQDGYDFTNTYNKTYKVNYKFINGTEGKNLPEEIKNLLPAEETGKENNSQVEPATKTFADIVTDDGRWTFIAWDENSKTIKGSDVKFVGTWVFKEKKADEENPPTNKITTVYVDEYGNEISPSKDGDHDKENIPGYEYIKTVRAKITDTETKVTHIYKKLKLEPQPPIGPEILDSSLVLPFIFGHENSKTTSDNISLEEISLNNSYSKAYIFGYPDGTFQPNKTMTRAEVVTMFFRLLKNSPSADANYKLSYGDVFENDWYYPALLFMTENAIITGYEDGTFRPNSPITRAEFAAIAAKFKGLVASDAKGFEDVLASHWALKYINSVYAKGWVSGYEDGSFRPDRNISRAEVVTITNKMLKRRPDVDFIKSHKDKLKAFKDLDQGHWAYFDIIEASQDLASLK